MGQHARVTNTLETVYPLGMKADDPSFCTEVDCSVDEMRRESAGCVIMKITGCAMCVICRWRCMNTQSFFEYELSVAAFALSEGGATPADVGVAKCAGEDEVVHGLFSGAIHFVERDWRVHHLVVKVKWVQDMVDLWNSCRWVCVPGEPNCGAICATPLSMEVFERGRGDLGLWRAEVEVRALGVRPSAIEKLPHCLIGVGGCFRESARRKHGVGALVTP